MKKSTLHSSVVKYAALVTCIAVLCVSYPPAVAANTQNPRTRDETQLQIETLTTRIAELYSQLTYLQSLASAAVVQSGTTITPDDAHRPISVPFYSQFTDITKPGWQKIGCGIASVAMLIDYYSDQAISVDRLLEQGIANNAYLSDAGWIHAGLIGLSQAYGLDGQSVSLAHLSAKAAVTELSTVLADGPVMASVHYTFEPTNPIPHLVVVNAIKDGMVYYNDPAESVGNGSLSIEQFKRGWKQRYIVIRPV